MAQRVCMPMKTQQLVAADLSGLRMMPSGNLKSMEAKVVLQIGQIVEKIFVEKVGDVAYDCLRMDII